jgi:hypothetical protein
MLYFLSRDRAIQRSFGFKDYTYKTMKGLFH